MMHADPITAWPSNTNIYENKIVEKKAKLEINGADTHSRLTPEAEQLRW